MCFINEDHNVNFVKYAQSKNINVKLLTKETDSSIIEKYKLYFMDYGIIDEVKIIKKEDLDLSTEENLYYKTNLNLISSGKVYQSLASKMPSNQKIA